MNSITQNILITGAAGFIGMHLAEVFLKVGHNVHGIDSLNDYYDRQLKLDRIQRLHHFDNFKFSKINIADQPALEAVFKEGQFDLVVNLAAQAGVRYSLENPHAYLQSNLLGFLNVLECCKAHQPKHLVYASSSSVYGNRKEGSFSEDLMTDSPVSLYAATKKSNELLAYSYANLFGIPCTGLRFFTVYGPWGRPDMATFLFSEAILKGEPIEVFNEGNLYRDFTYIDDIVEGIKRISALPPSNTERVPHEVYNIGNNQPVKLLEFIETIEEVIGQKAIKKMKPMQAGDVFSTCADISKLHERTGFHPNTALKTGVKRFYEWYRAYYD